VVQKIEEVHLELQPVCVAFEQMELLHHTKKRAYLINGL
jgi:hypothetical protein